MHYTGQNYRPPVEADTPLLEVTIGCSHNRCAFCTMYRKTPFGVPPLSTVESDLQELRQTHGPELKRIFLLNGDPLVLPTDQLLAIAKLIHCYFPRIETITCYVSINNLKRKPLEELKQLRAMGFNDFYVGLETAYAPALAMMNKGFTVEEAYEELGKLKEADIRYAALLMLGVAGKGNGEVNVRETVKLLNRIPPFLVSALTTSAAPGSDLARLRDEGVFVEQTERETLEEEMLLIRSLEVEDCYFFGSHYFNLASANGWLPRDREQILENLQQTMEEFEPEILDGVIPRGSV